VLPATQKDPEGWGPTDKFAVVLEAAGLNATELGAYCRKRGLFPEQVDRLRQAAQDANAQPLLRMAEQKDLEKRHQQDQREIRRQHHPPRTPLQRLLATGQMSEEKTTQLRELQRGTDPLMLLETIRRCQGQLALLASGEQNAGLGPGGAVAYRTQGSRSLEVFLGDLEALWRTSQLHHRPLKTRTCKRSRPGPFEPDEALIDVWLEEEPQLGSRELMERLVAHIEECYSARQMRRSRCRLRRQHRLRRIEAEITGDEGRRGTEVEV
jgi:hypothetical protein